MDGLERIIDACGRNGVVELHIGDVAVFRTEGNQYLVHQSRKPASPAVDAATPTPTPDIPARGGSMTADKRRILEEQRELMADQEFELDLVDPVAAEKLMLEEHRKTKGS